MLARTSLGPMFSAYVNSALANDASLQINIHDIEQPVYYAQVAHQ